MSNHNPEAFKGFIRYLTDFKMRVRMFICIVLFILVVQVIFNGFNFFLLPTVFPEAKLIYLKTLWAMLLMKVPYLCDMTFFTAGPYSVSANQWSAIYQKLYIFYTAKIGIGLKRSFVIWLLLPSTYLFFWYKSRNVLKEKYIRGTVMLSERDYARIIKKDANDIELNKQISIPFHCENRHFLTIGKPGVGKTQLLCRAIDKVVKRNAKAIIYDFKGDYISRFYNPATDVIFNPLDQRSVGWCLFNEVNSQTNLEAIAASLIPSNNKSEPFWENAARDVLYSVLFYCWKNNLTSNARIYEFSIKSREELLKCFMATPGCERGVRPLEETKVGASVLSTFSQYVKFLEYTREMTGDFSIKKWVGNEEQRGRIFITNYAEISQVMRPLISLFVDIFANHVLMLPEDVDRRIFVFLDEFGTLQGLNNIINMLKLSRSYGGSVWIGIQDVGQIENVYGKDSTKTILNSCGNSILFGVDEPQTAEQLAKKIGERERSNIDKNFSFGLSEYRDGHSISERTMVERAVLPSDIMGLADLHFYFKLAAIREFTRSKLDYKKFPVKNKSFIEKEHSISQIPLKLTAQPMIQAITSSREVIDD